MKVMPILWKWVLLFSRIYDGLLEGTFSTLFSFFLQMEIPEWHALNVASLWNVRRRLLHVSYLSQGYNNPMRHVYTSEQLAWRIRAEEVLRGLQEDGGDERNVLSLYENTTYVEMIGYSAFQVFDALLIWF